MGGASPEAGLEALVEEKFCARWADAAFVDLLCNHRGHVFG